MAKRSRGGSVVVILVVLWLLIGLLAAFQRDYFGGKDKPSCAKVSNIVLTIVAGPLNYVGVNPKVKCQVPQPSK
jgi:ABC-type cobalt transport system substrate-binding protein